MLKLTNIKKSYLTGAERVDALKGINLRFRKNEFVSILGPSGCGKTTLLNIIGGLDQYTEGDLVIRGRSTKKYSARDWDTYRNHSVGFVFQSYNLIPHQSVLANVELALTLSGVNKKERRRRAAEALERVGLGNQLHKKPNQMSGGQMQRVAIARAIVNNPEILMADEPTGALDSETSVQVMEILKDIAKDRLVIMVTHNPELAEQYSTRIIRLFDGEVVGDTMPYTNEEAKGTDEAYRPKKNRSMSFITALGLSIKNLMTKKGRTVMTSFAGSIGIIGIALILSVSNGVNIFIDKIQQDTLAKYPLTISSSAVDLSSMFDGMAENENTEIVPEDKMLYDRNSMVKMMSSMSSLTGSKNNMSKFKAYIDGNAEFRKYASAIQYRYAIPMNFFYENDEQQIVKADSAELITSIYKAMGIGVDFSEMSGIFGGSSGSSMWEEMLAGSGGELINPTIIEQYDIVDGQWPKNESEVVLLVNEKNQVDDFVLYALGMKSTDEIGEMMKKAMNGEKINTTPRSFATSDFLGKEFRLLLSADLFRQQQDGSYRSIADNSDALKAIYGNSDKYVKVTISGIIRPNEDAVATMLSGSLCYTTALTDHMIEKTGEVGLIKEQLANPDVDILSGLPFNVSGTMPSNSEKIDQVKSYFAGLNDAEKASMYVTISSRATDEEIALMSGQLMESYTRDMAVEMMLNAAVQGGADPDTMRSTIEEMPENDLRQAFENALSQFVPAMVSEKKQEQYSAMSVDQLTAYFNAAEYSDSDYLYFYDNYLPATFSDSDYKTVLNKIGYVDKDDPAEIVLYADNFNDKNEIGDLIDAYNEGVEEVDQIKYTDYIKLLMSSVSTVFNAVSYVLIAFVGISLVVSSIMIGVITNISVLERTKEIGILRAIGASKRDVGHVFNAETFIIGLFSGLMGIGITLILIIPINIILHHFTDISYLNAALPAGGALILVTLSMLLTVIAGLIPSRSASKKDPVIALRSE